jgi:hypothetical protein
LPDFVAGFDSENDGDFNMSTDNLDQLSDRELDAVFAAEVCGWVDLIPLPFSTCATDVLEHMRSDEEWVFHFSPQNGLWHAHKYSGNRYRNSQVVASAKTFALVACIALIRARRAEKGAGK